jgi:subtilisin family serine protease
MKLKVILSLLLLSTNLNAANLSCRGQLRVAVIDSGLDLNDPRLKDHLCKTGHKNFVTGETLNDTVGHGTHIASLIQQYVYYYGYCMLIYKYYSDHASGTLNLEREILAFQEAIDNKADIINFSGGGPVFEEEESLIIKNHPEVTFVVAAGNEHQDLDIPGNEYFPASLFYKNMEVVGSMSMNGERSSFSNYGSRVKYVEMGENVVGDLPNGAVGQMSGTSQATAIHTGKLIDKLSRTCKYSR